MNSLDRPLDLVDQTIGSASPEMPQRRGIRALMAVDRWSRTNESTEFLARILPPDSSVRILTVVSYQAQPESMWNRLGEPGEAEAQIPASQSEVLSSARHILETAGAQVSATHRFGYPADEILNEGSDWGADVILVGHHNGLARWFLGSVTESIVQRSHLPVLVVPRLSVGNRRHSLQEPVKTTLKAELLA